MIKHTFTNSAKLALVAVGGMLTAAAAQATVTTYDLGSNGSATVNGAEFTVSATHPAGTGVYDPFLTIQNTGVEQGYNGTNNNFDTKRVPVWNHEIQFSDLQVTTINGASYYGFEIDINEPNGSKSLISLDAFRVYTSATTQSSTSTNSSGYFNGSLGTLRYDLGNNSIVYDDQHSGSGTADISVYIPAAYFAGSQPGDYVYLYERFGSADPTATAQGGFEETRLIAGVTPVPELSSFFPIVGLLVAVFATNFLRKRRAAQISA